jgi:hypothetical protein
MYYAPKIYDTHNSVFISFVPSCFAVFAGYCGDVLVEMRKASKVLRLFSKGVEAVEAADGSAQGAATVAFDDFHHAFLRLNVGCLLRR